TIETADIALMADRLTRLPQSLILAKRTACTMRVYITIALATVLVPVLGVFLGGVTMAVGMLVHGASVLLVIAIAMTLLRPVRTQKLYLGSALVRRPLLAGVGYSCAGLGLGLLYFSSTQGWKPRYSGRSKRS